MKLKFLILFAVIAITLIVLQLAIVNAVTISSVSTFPSEIKPGETATLNIELENNLQDNVEDVEIELDLTNVPFAPYKSSSEVSIDKIKEDKSETIEFEIITLSDAKSGIYKIPLKISYHLEDETEIKEKKSTISITVNAEPKLSLSVEDSVLIKGKKNKLTLKIVNSGLGDVKFLTVKINNVPNLQILSSSLNYIGDIDSDDFDSLEIETFIKNEAPNIISLTVEINYRDAITKEFSMTENVQLKTYTAQEAIKLGLLPRPNYALYIISAVVVIGFILYRIIRKRKRKQKTV